MATRKQTVDGLSEAAEVNPVTTEASAQNMGADLLFQVSRGQRSPQYGAEQIAAVLTSLAAPSPIKAGLAVRTFFALRVNDNNSFEMGDSFKSWIVEQISKSASPEALAKLKRDANSDDRLSAWFCLSPPNITIATVNRGGYMSHGTMFFPEVRTKENMRRRGVETVVRLDLTILLHAAGKLLADTLAREPTAPLLPPGSLPARGEKDGGTTPETTKAAEPASSNGLQSGQPAPKAQTAPVNTAQSATGKGSKQLLPDPAAPRSQVRHRTSIERTRHNGAHWTDAAPP